MSYTSMFVVFIVSLCLSSALCAIASHFGAMKRETEIYREAIRAHAGQWYVDQDTGKKSFRFFDQR